MMEMPIVDADNKVKATVVVGNDLYLFHDFGPCLGHDDLVRCFGLRDCCGCHHDLDGTKSHQSMFHYWTP
jgi:hypothetical protein